MFCSGCGRQMDAGQQFCAGCGLKNPAVQSSSMVAPFGTAVAGTGVAPAQQQIVVLAEKNAGLAAVLSFFWSGLGQIYNGEMSKGILLMVIYPSVWVCSWLLIASIVGSPFGVLLILTIPILWIYGMVDAYRTAEKFNASLRVGR